MSWMAAFCAGIIILYCSGRLLPWHCYIFIVISCGPLLYWRQARFLLPLLLGLFWANLQVEERLAQALPEKAFGQPVEVGGWFCSLPKERPFSLQVDVCLDRAFQPAFSYSDFAGRRVRVNLDGALLPESPLQYFRFTLRLKKPVGRLNPLTRSVEASWFRENVVALGRIQSLEPADIDDFAPEQALQQYLLELRWRAWRHISTLTGGLHHRGLIHALYMGERSAISPEDNHLLTYTGTQHLMAISGLHVGLIIGFLHFLLPKSRAGLALIVVCSASYVLLVGAPPSAQRAWLMAMLVLLVGRGYIAHRPATIWWLAMSLVLLFDPAACLSAGFWYSFLAVGCLLYMWRLGLINGSWQSLIGVQGVLFLFLHGFNVWLGMPSHPVSVLANLVAIPWVSLVVLPLVLLSAIAALVAPALGTLGMQVIDIVLQGLLAYFASLVPLQNEINSAFTMTDWLMSVFLLLVFLLLRAFRWYALVLLFVIVLVQLQAVPSEHSRDEILFWDAGQGLAVVMHGPDFTWLYDLGPEWWSGSLAENELLPYLRKRGVQDQVAGVVLSHGDLDHAGGAVPILSALRPAVTWVGEPERHQLPVPFETCRPGMRWQRGTWRIEVIYAAGSEAATANNRSCVTLVSVDGFRVLLMGDLEGEEERRFLRTYKGDLRADILLAGHHGARWATSYALLKRVLPDYVVFAAPYNSRFGHPHPDVLKRVRQVRSEVIHLGRTGALHVYPGSRQTVVAERKLRTPFWLSHYQ